MLFRDTALLDLLLFRVFDQDDDNHLVLTRYCACLSGMVRVGVGVVERCRRVRNEP
jgi:hypothetical protein